MSDCLVTGITNAGKTCFVINFAEYMGLKDLKFYVRQSSGYTVTKNYSLNQAKEKLICSKKNFTIDIHSVNLTIPVGKTFKEIKIIDSCGLSEGIHPEAEIRHAMAQTISLLNNSKLILHIIDLSTIDPANTDLILDLDKMIMDYVSDNKSYVILLNKIDLVSVQDKITIFKNKFKSKTIIPISALYQKGFKEVKKLVLNYV